MRNSETGEYELVMGNRQLLSGFFIVALLFGVAFAMGYIVGRNSSPAAKVQADTSGQTAQTIEQRPPASGAAVTPPPAEAPKTQPPAETGTRPAETTPVSAVAPVAERPADPAAPAAPSSDLPSGAYWQVIAVKQAEAESVQKALREKTFPAHLTPGPNGLVRVIVGPYNDRDTLGKAKAELENAGFHPHLVKR